MLLTSQEHDKLQILVRNARQILDIVTATYSGSSGGKQLDCLHPGSSAEELACEWQQINKMNKTMPTEEEDDVWIMQVSKVRNQRYFATKRRTD